MTTQHLTTQHHIISYAKISSPIHYKRELHIDLRISFSYDPDRVEGGFSDNPFDITEVLYSTWDMKALAPMPDSLRHLLDIEEMALTPKFEATISQLERKMKDQDNG